MSGGWDILDEDELLNRPPWVRVVAETVRLEDGQTVVHDFYRVDIPDFAIMFALTADGRVPLIEQYRHGVRRRVLELPAGGIFGDEAPLAAAQRELLEEAGIESPQWIPLGVLTIDPNRGCGHAHVYLALDAVPVAAPDPGDLSQQTVHFFTLDQIRAFWTTPDCPIASSTAAIGLALAYLSVHGSV
jgi:ADP-ribose pyrophosphatase